MTQKWDCAPAAGGCTMIINTQQQMPAGLLGCSKLETLDGQSVEFSWRVVFVGAGKMRTAVAWYYETELCHVGDC
jgi:hypothetical protein